MVDQSKLQTEGKVYHLKKIYDFLNKEYFNERLNLLITWFETPPSHKQRRRMTFGLFYDPLRLIKINKLLDDQFFPEYVVSFVIYHEMLHAACPSYVDEKGLHRIHNKEFKKKEELFHYFDEAQNWIRTHQSDLFDRLNQNR